MQEKFRPAIYEFGKIVHTAQKMIEACKILNIPIYCTTQNAARLGPTVSEISSIFPPETDEVDKTAFSMMIPAIQTRLSQQSQAFASTQYPSSHNHHQHSTASSPSAPPPPTSTPLPTHPSRPTSTPPSTSTCQILLVGIETHICVLQTATDLLSRGHRVYILTDGVSSCNAGERGVALDRLRQEGCTVTTSESVLFELVGDAGAAGFREVSALVKRWKGETAAAVGGGLVEGLYGGSTGSGGSGSGSGSSGDGGGGGGGGGEGSASKL